VSCLLRLAFIFDGLSGCGFSHPYAIAFYSLTAGPNSGGHLKIRHFVELLPCILLLDLVLDDFDLRIAQKRFLPRTLVDLHNLSLTSSLAV